MKIVKLKAMEIVKQMVMEIVMHNSNPSMTKGGFHVEKVKKVDDIIRLVKFSCWFERL